MARQHRVEEPARVSRKDVLMERKRRRQNRQLYMAVGAVVGLLAVVFIAALVYTFLIRPRQPVAVVQGERITLQQWEQRVRFQRAQLIMNLEDIRDLLDGNIGLVQQYAGQQISLLAFEPTTLGQLVLDSMIEERLIRQEAEARGITVTDADVQAEIEQNFNYFGGELPEPTPTPTETLVPTPTITPIPTPVITEVVPTLTPMPTFTPGPTATPLPTATPVTTEGFRDQYQELMSRLRRLGTNEATYREVVRASLYHERLLEALTAEVGVETEAEHVSFYYLRFETEAEANEARAQIEAEDFLTVWNTIRSQPRDAEQPPTAAANEVLWRYRDALEGAFSDELLTAAFTLPPGQTSDMISEEGDPETGRPSRYYIIQVTGREVRELAEGVVRSRQQEMLTTWLESRRLAGIEVYDQRIAQPPRQPVLDPVFYTQPQQEQPLIPVPEN
jgi:hypothetical protein